jgi:hypothetical protein
MSRSLFDFIENTKPEPKKEVKTEQVYLLPKDEIVSEEHIKAITILKNTYEVVIE